MATPIAASLRSARGLHGRLAASRAAAVVLVLLWTSLAWAVERQPAAAKADDLSLEEALEPLRPVRPRTGAERDRTRALALFAAARICEQRQDFARALQLYQRAERFDPGALPILRQIVPLAFNLDRHAEAVRYALMIAERDDTDPVLLRRLSLYLTETGDWSRAIRLYEKAAIAQSKDKPSASAVQLAMEMGRLYYLTKKYDLAAEKFALVIKALDDPKPYGLDDNLRKAILGDATLTYQLIAESLLEAGRFNLAEAAFKRANTPKRDEALLAYNLARLERARKRPAEALRHLETFFEHKSSLHGAGPYELLSQVLTDLGRGGEVIAYLEKFHRQDPANPPLAAFLGTRYQQAGETEKAAAAYRTAIAKSTAQPSVDGYQGLLGLYHAANKPGDAIELLGGLAAQTGSLSAAADAYSKAIADKAFIDAMLNAVLKAVQSGKTNFDQCLAGGLVALEARSYEHAEKLLDAAIKTDGSKGGPLLVSWGMELFLDNEYARAAKVFQRGIDAGALPADNPTLHFYLAGSLEMAGRTDEALAAARKAAAIQADAPRLLSRVAWIQYHAGRLDDAKQSYLQLIERFKAAYDSPETREVLRDARLVLSNIAVAQNNLPAAEEYLEQVLDEFPRDIGALNDLGYLWADQGKYLERACAMIEEAVKAEPDNKAYRDSYGWVLYRLGRYSQSVEQLKIASSDPEPDGLILEHLGDALFKAGNLAGAVETWSRAVTILEKQGDTDKAKLTQEKIRTARDPKPLAAQNRP